MTYAYFPQSTFHFSNPCYNPFRTNAEAQHMRKRYYEIIEKSDGSDKLSTVYDIAMIVLIFMSILPLMFKEDNRLFSAMDKIAVSVFIVDYFLRWATADFKFPSQGIIPFVRYPFSFMAIIDLVSILPSLTILNNSFMVLRIFRMGRAARVFRVFKAFRYSRNFEIIGRVLRSSKDSLIAVGTLAAAYILISAIIIFNVEPDSFSTFFDAVYWATVSLTTVGYGDIYPITTAGRMITMASSIFGIAIVALPAGIITAGYMSEIQKMDNDNNDDLEK